MIEAIERIVKEWGTNDLTNETFKNGNSTFMTKKGLEGQMKTMKEDGRMNGSLFYYDPSDCSLKMVSVKVD